MARNNGYSAAELMAMQRDAADRVREMQRRARERMGNGAPPSPPAAIPSSPVRELPAHEGNRPPASPGNGLRELVRQFTGDPDRLLLLVLVILLSQEDTDPALLVALVWLML